MGGQDNGTDQEQGQHQFYGIAKAGAAQHQCEYDGAGLIWERHQCVSVDDGHEHSDQRQLGGTGEVAREW